MSRRASLSKWFWQLAHPREAQGRAHVEAEASVQEQIEISELVQEASVRIAEQRAEWLAVARDLEASPAELRRILSECSFLQPEGEGARARVRALVSSESDGTAAWRTEFWSTLYSHPNLPLELFGNEIPIWSNSVAGLLKNPVCPLLFLERPDFIASLSEKNQRALCHYALQHNGIPPSFLHALTSVGDPWVALEARTHVAAIQDETAAPLDLAWLEEQIVVLLQQEDFAKRCLLYELEWHGLIPQGTVNDPWKERYAATSSAMTEQVEECIRQAQAVAKRGRNAQREWSTRWIPKGNSMSDDLFDFLHRVVSYTGVPQWVLREFRNAEAWAFRLPLAQHPETPTADVAECKQEVVKDALSAVGVMRLYTERLRTTTTPGTFYLAFRNLPEPLTGTKLTGANYDITESIGKLHFLARLAIALRLDDTDPDQLALRTKLWEDPNRYVRAAARKELIPLDRR